MVKAYGDDAPKYPTIVKWAQMFKFGRESLEDEPRSGGPRTAMTPENVNAVLELIINDRRIDTRKIAAILGISRSSVQSIIHEEFEMKKICVRWVPKMLRKHEMNERVSAAKELLTIYNSDPENFEERLICCDETWIHHYVPESKVQSMEWKHKGSPRPTKAKAKPSAGKVLATFYRDSKGVIMVDYFPSGKTIIGPYYAELLRKLR